MSAMTSPAVKAVRRHIHELSANEQARGETRGALAAKREILHSLVQQKFATSTQEVEARLNEADIEQLDHWSKGVLTASTLEELFVN